MSVDDALAKYMADVPHTDIAVLMAIRQAFRAGHASARSAPDAGVRERTIAASPELLSIMATVATIEANMADSRQHDSEALANAHRRLFQFFADDDEDGDYAAATIMVSALQRALKAEQAGDARHEFIRMASKVGVVRFRTVDGSLMHLRGENLAQALRALLIHRGLLNNQEAQDQQRLFAMEASGATRQQIEECGLGYLLPPTSAVAAERLKESPCDCRKNFKQSYAQSLAGVIYDDCLKFQTTRAETAERELATLKAGQADAVAAERERCAGIADAANERGKVREQECRHCGDIEGAVRCAVAANQAWNIASLIRAQPGDPDV